MSYPLRKFEELQATGRKVGEDAPEIRPGGMHDVDHPDEFDDEDSKCGLEEEGQSHHEDESEDEEKNV